MFLEIIFSMCSNLPAPPQAITGTPTVLLTSSISSKSKPDCVPSLSTEVNKISPTPKPSAFLTQSKTLISVFSLPLSTKASQYPPSLLLASIDKTIHWLPKILLASLISSGFLIAAVLIATLSAPFLRAEFISSTDLIPPPTVIGTNIF